MCVCVCVCVKMCVLDMRCLYLVHAYGGRAKSFSPFLYQLFVNESERDILVVKRSHVRVMEGSLSHFILSFTPSTSHTPFCLSFIFTLPVVSNPSFSRER